VWREKIKHAVIGVPISFFEVLRPFTPSGFTTTGTNKSSRSSIYTHQHQTAPDDLVAVPKTSRSEKSRK
jgi:hypothetical protein